MSVSSKLMAASGYCAGICGVGSWVQLTWVAHVSDHYAQDCIGFILRNFSISCSAPKDVRISMLSGQISSWLAQARSFELTSDPPLEFTSKRAFPSSG